MVLGADARAGGECGGLLAFRHCAPARCDFIRLFFLAIFGRHFAGINQSRYAGARQAFPVALEAAAKLRAVGSVLRAEILVIARAGVSHLGRIRHGRRREEKGSARRGGSGQNSFRFYHSWPL